MSYSFKCWSHPGKLLKDHISNVYDNGMLIADKLNLDKRTQGVLKISLLLHDVGKASSYFQKYIKAIDDFEKGEISKSVFEEIKYNLKGKKQHARISALWAFLILDQLYEDPGMAFLGYAIVLKHHGHLDNVDEMVNLEKHQAKMMAEINREIDYGELNELIKLKLNIDTTLNEKTMASAIDNFFNSRRFRRKWKRSVKEYLSYDLFLKTSLLFSILLSADKGECIFDGVIYKRNKTFLPDQLVDIYKQKKFGKPNSKLNLLRENVYKNSEKAIKKVDNQERFFSINVPTGIGKTLTVLNSAIKLVNSREDLDKIIYCLPFTSVIDQNAAVIEDILEVNNLELTSDSLLVNHHLSEVRYKSSEDDIDFDINKAEYLVNQFEASISVTTFYQLLHGVLSRSNRELRKLHSFANSVIILDEVQSIPSKYWELIKEVFLDLAKRLNITFILVTATLPMIFSEQKNEITELVKNKEEVFASLNRIVLDVSYLHEQMDIESFADHLIDEISLNPDRSYLLIVNTLKSSQKLFELLDAMDFENLMYLSTSLPPIERLRRIKKIKESDASSIVVSTQLVEAGVDIDLDIVYRDLAPLDSIFQSAGRCNRNDGDTKGEVRIVNLKSENGRRFANYIYSDADLDLTESILKEKKRWQECEFYDLANKYYSAIDLSYPDPKEILKNMNMMNYRDAFDTSQNKMAFQLIEELPKVPAYIALEDEAIELRKKFEAAINTDYDSIFEKKRIVNKIRKEMSKYFVSVPEKYAFEIENMFFVISEERQDFNYKPAIGIDYLNEQSSMII